MDSGWQVALNRLKMPLRRLKTPLRDSGWLFEDLGDSGGPIIDLRWFKGETDSSKKIQLDLMRLRITFRRPRLSVNAKISSHYDLKHLKLSTISLICHKTTFLPNKIIIPLLLFIDFYVLKHRMTGHTHQTTHLHYKSQ